MTLQKQLQAAIKTAAIKNGIRIKVPVLDCWLEAKERTDGIIRISDCGATLATPDFGMLPLATTKFWDIIKVYDLQCARGEIYTEISPAEEFSEAVFGLLHGIILTNYLIYLESMP